MQRITALLLASLLVGCGSSDEGPAAATPADDAATVDTATPDDTGTDTSEPADTGAATDSEGSETETDSGGAIPCTETGGKIFSGNGHCYFPLPAEKTLVGSATECTMKKAHIVTISSGEEQDFLKDLGTGERWIGLTSKDPTTNKSDFDWLGGEAVTYDGWSSGSPASRGRCAVILPSGKWEDRSCSDALRIGLCEREMP